MRKMVKSKKKMKESRHKSQSLQEDNDEVPISSSTISDTIKVSDTIQSKSSSASNASLSDHDNNDDEEEDDALFNDAVSKWAELKEKEEQQLENVEQASSHHNKSTANKSKSSQSINISERGTEIAYIGNRNATTANTKKNSFSLHITNLPYTAQKETISNIFTKHGCRVTSTRLVFNYHNKNRMNTKSEKSNPKSNGFTGVAFVDLADKKSFQKGLELNRLRWSHLVEDGKKQVKGNPDDKKKKKNIDKDIDTSYNGRINVRPTKTPEELAQIVNNTKEKLAMKRKQEEHNDHSQEVQEPSPKRQKKNQSSRKPQGSGANSVKPVMKRKQDIKDHKHDRVQRPSPKKQKLNHSPQSTTNMKGTTAKTSKTKKSRENQSNKNESPDRKLTKKDRARKAAILRSKKVQKNY